MLTSPNLIPDGVQSLVEIDPVLTRWIAENARAGVDPGAVVAAMYQAGWAEADAARSYRMWSCRFSQGSPEIRLSPRFMHIPFLSRSWTVARRMSMLVTKWLRSS